MKMPDRVWVMWSFWASLLEAEDVYDCCLWQWGKPATAAEIRAEELEMEAEFAMLQPADRHGRRRQLTARANRRKMRIIRNVYWFKQLDGQPKDWQLTKFDWCRYREKSRPTLKQRQWQRQICRDLRLDRDDDFNEEYLLGCHDESERHLFF